MKHVLKHEIYGDVLFDTKTQTFQVIDYERIYGESLVDIKKHDEIKMFNGGKKPFRYFDSVGDFINTTVIRCVVPLVCTGIKPIKKRTMATLIDINNTIIELYNVEIGGTSMYGKPIWLNNKIDNLYSGRCYFCIIERNENAINNFLLINTKEITKGMHEALPLGNVNK